MAWWTVSIPSWSRVCVAQSTVHWRGSTTPSLSGEEKWEHVPVEEERNSIQKYMIGSKQVNNKFK